MRIVWIVFVIGCGSPASPDPSEVTEEEETCDQTETFYADADGDGFGDPSVSTAACSVPSGYVADASDCDDTSGAVHPAATEVCDPFDVDENCNGTADEDDPTLDGTSRPMWYPDRDSDGYGDELATPLANCEVPLGAVDNGDDCNDEDGEIHPAAVEICDGLQIDEDCNGLSDDDDPGVDLVNTGQLLFIDTDLDGHGDENDPGTLACLTVAGISATNDDCDDSDLLIHPAADEICDPLDVDENCNGLADDDDPTISDAPVWYPDVDGDGFGDFDNPVVACDAPLGFISDGTDCDDADPLTLGGAQFDLTLTAVTNMSVDYLGNLVIFNPNRHSAYQSNASDLIGWALFDLGPVAGMSTVSEMTLSLHGENQYGSPYQNPETVLVRSPDDGWDRVSASKFTVAIAEEISPVVTTFFDPTTWNDFEIDPGSFDWRADVQDGFLTIGIDNDLLTYSYVYFFGVDDLATAPRLRIVGSSCN